MADPPAPALPKEAKKGPVLRMLNPLLLAFRVTRHEHDAPGGPLVFEHGVATEVPADLAPAIDAHRITLADPPVAAVVPYVPPPGPAAN